MIYTDLLTFWLITQLFGLIGLPIAFVLLKKLPDKGYVFVKPLGLLLSAYILWLGGSFGLLGNNIGSVVFAMLIVMGLGTAWVWPQRLALLNWLNDNRAYIFTVETIYSLAYIGWAYYKAHNPDITTAGGEKWMEIAFINSALLSPSYPPQDPWLSGYGISYYYFGYIMMAILTRLSGIVSTTAFNLYIPTLFSLTLIAAFGLMTNIVCIHQESHAPTRRAGRVGLLGALFVGVMGHWEGLLEVLHSRGLLSAAFWQWLDIRDLKIPPTAPGPWIPTRFIWWWRGSRVLTDYNLAGQEQEVIDEMPFFSFLLGDVHPHVLALPFVLLALALALNLLLNRRKNGLSQSTFDANNEEVKTAKASRIYHPFINKLRQSVVDLVQATGGPIAFLLYTLCLGALGFLNTWDLPIYLAVMGFAYWLWRRQKSITEPIIGMAVFAIVSIGLYLTFYISFQSQAGGILPNWWNPTRLPQFIVFFGPFLISLIAFLLTLSMRDRLWVKNLAWSLPLMWLTPIILFLALTIFFSSSSAGRDYIQSTLNNPLVQEAIQGAEMRDLWREVVRRRISNPWTFLILGSLLAWSVSHWWLGVQRIGHKTEGTEDGSRQFVSGRTSTGLGYAEEFILTMLILGLLLPLSVEFIFLRDLFNIRMNTIFKFYYQAWVLLALASAFGVYYVYQALPSLGRWLWSGCLVLVILAGLVYPVLATLNRANNFAGEASLDGIRWVATYNPDDHAAIMWLRQHTAPDAIILEASGSSYRYDNRISALTGRATLLGWGFHENQWRGTYDEPRRREADIATIFNSADPLETLTLIEKYDIRYIYIGQLERERYSRQGLAKFERMFNIAFAQGDVVVYMVKE